MAAWKLSLDLEPEGRFVLSSAASIDPGEGAALIELVGVFFSYCIVFFILYSALPVNPDQEPQGSVFFRPAASLKPKLSESRVIQKKKPTKKQTSKRLSLWIKNDENAKQSPK